MTWGSALRMAIYGWIAIECFTIAVLYLRGYYRFKKSRLIFVMITMFACLGLNYLFLFVAPWVSHNNPEAYKGMITYNFLFNIPLGLAIYKFRTQSVEPD